MMIVLPPELTAAALDDLLSQWDEAAQQIVIDFGSQRWVHPAGTVVLSCLVARAFSQDRGIEFNVNGCRNLGYWQRMRFFANFGRSSIAGIGEAKAAEGRFSEIRSVHDIHETDSITDELVSVASPDQDASQI